MESSELALYRGLGAVRNYGIMVLVALLILNGVALGTLNWLETNDIRSELASLAEKLPSPSAAKTEQVIVLPADIISFRVSKVERVGFYETKIEDMEYLAYGSADKNYVLMKSEDSIKHEVLNFAFALFALYLGEVVILLGWWLFVRTKVRELFEIM